MNDQANEEEAAEDNPQVAVQAVFFHRVSFSFLANNNYTYINVRASFRILNFTP